MEIRWIQAVIDLPAAVFDDAAQFWVDVTGSTRGDIHPDHDEYVHLIPPTGDMHLELQRIDAGPPRVHLDLLVDDIGATTTRAVGIGATLISQPGHAVLETPGGVPFCIVPYTDEAERAPVIDTDHPHAVDQICLDIPHEHFEADINFWAQLTRWQPNPAPALAEFRSFDQPKHLPLRVLLQQLGVDDTGGGRAHLDISSGDHVTHLTIAHERHGAAVRERFKHWTALTDPSGLPYCLTTREPFRF